jgi:OmpA-OmpF porin, OOP family
MKTKLIIALIAASAASFAQAQSYIGANVGRSELKANLEGAPGSFKDTDTGVKLYGGYQFNPTFGVEAGYNNLGKGSIFNDTITAKPESLYLAGTATFPINQEFAVFGKLGAARTRTKINGGGSSFNEFHNTAVAGIGASYAFTKEVSGVIEYENFGKIVKDGGDTLKGNLISVGVRYKF